MIDRISGWKRQSLLLDEILRYFKSELTKEEEAEEFFSSFKSILIYFLLILSFVLLFPFLSRLSNVLLLLK